MAVSLLTRASAAVATPLSWGSARAGLPRLSLLRAAGTLEQDVHRVLLVEPKAQSRALLSLALRRAGFEVTAVEGTAALEELAPGRPVASLVIADAQGGGLGLCERIRADEAWAHVPVLLLASDGSPVQELGAQAGADDCLRRPVFVRDVVALAMLRAGSRFGARVFEVDPEELPLPGMLRALLAGSRSGRVELKSRQGSLAFKKGRVVSARFEGTRGEDGLERMLLFGEGGYTVSFGPGLGEGPMYLGQRELCGAILPEVKSWEWARRQGPSLSARLAVDFRRLAAVGKDLPEEVEALVRLADGHRTVRQVLLDSGLPPVTALKAVTRLAALGVLADLQGPAALREGPHASAVALSAMQPPASSPALLLRPSGEVPAQLMRPDGPLPEEPRTPNIRGTRPADVLRDLEEAWFAPGPAGELPAEPPPSPSHGRGWPRWLVPATALVAAAGLAAPALTHRGLPGMPFVRRVPTLKMDALVITASPTGREEMTPGARGRLVSAMDVYAQGRPGDAARLLEALASDHPGLAEGWLALGMARFDSGDSSGARAAAERVLELDPGEPRVHMLLASIYLADSDARAARAELQAYLAKAPKGDFAAEARALLEEPAAPARP